jgi:hypothetical protein
MSDDRRRYETQIYTCMAKGHDGDIDFEAVEEEWFLERGLSAPLNCPECRAWYNAQLEIGPTDSKCFICGYHWPTEPLFRISYHKRHGNWEEFAESAEGQTCLHCKQNPHRQQKMKNRNAMLRLRDKMPDFSKNKIKFSPAHDAYAVPGADDLAFYERTKLFSSRATHGKNQLEHLLKPEHLWREKLGSSDPRPFIAAAARLARETGRDIAQIKQRNGSVLKCDMRTGLVVIVKSDAASKTGNSLETAFFNETPKKYIEGRILKRSR